MTIRSASASAVRSASRCRCIPGRNPHSAFQNDSASFTRLMVLPVPGCRSSQARSSWQRDVRSREAVAGPEALTLRQTRDRRTESGPVGLRTIEQVRPQVCHQLLETLP